MKNKGWIYVLICLCIILAMGLTIFLIQSLNGNSRFFFGRKNVQISDQKVHDQLYDSSLERIEIGTDAGNVEISSSQDETIHVIVYGEEDQTKVNQKGNELEIQTTTKKCVGFCFSEKISKIIVLVPNSFDGVMEIRNHFGDIAIDEFQYASIIVEADCGNVEIESANKVDIKNNYGNISVSSSVDATVRASAGNIQIGTVTSAKVQNSFGSIKIEKVLSEIDLENNCGDIVIDEAMILKDSKIEGDLGSIKIRKINDIYIDASADLGNVTVEKNNNQSEVTLRIHNDCGEIKVEK